MNKSVMKVKITDNHMIKELVKETKLADRISYLAAISEEESKESPSEQEPMRMESLKDFISFIKNETGLADPSIVLTYTGNIRASWGIKMNQHFAVEFMGNGDIKYVLFAESKKPLDGTQRSQGACHFDKLMFPLRNSKLIDFSFVMGVDDKNV